MSLASRFLIFFGGPAGPSSAMAASATLQLHASASLNTGAALSAQAALAFGASANFAGAGAQMAATAAQAFAASAEIGSGFPVEPNPRRRIAVLSPDWIGTFPVMWTSAADVITFDMARLLAPVTFTDAAELIEEILSFTLEVDDRVATDGSPNNRILGIATFEGSQVSQRVGNWQDIPVIHYRVTAIVTTTHGNTVPLVGMLPVRKPPN